MFLFLNQVRSRSNQKILHSAYVKHYVCVLHRGRENSWATLASTNNHWHSCVSLKWDTYVLLLFKLHGSQLYQLLLHTRPSPNLKQKAFIIVMDHLDTWWWGSGLAVFSWAYSCICYQREMWVGAGEFRTVTFKWLLVICLTGRLNRLA